MNPEDLAAFSAALAVLPEGTVRGTAHTRRYVATKTLFNEGRSVKLVAEELGGADYISLNCYLLSEGPLLKPCEMSAEKVVAFVLGFVPDQEEA